MCINGFHTEKTCSKNILQIKVVAMRKKSLIVFPSALTTSQFVCPFCILLCRLIPSISSYPSFLWEAFLRGGLLAHWRCYLPNLNASLSIWNKLLTKRVNRNLNFEVNSLCTTRISRQHKCAVRIGISLWIKDQTNPHTFKKVVDYLCTSIICCISHSLFLVLRKQQTVTL